MQNKFLHNLAILGYWYSIRITVFNINLRSIGELNPIKMY